MNCVIFQNQFFANVYFLDANVVKELTTASKDLIDSQYTTPQAKAIFRRLIDIIPSITPCLINANYGCLSQFIRTVFIQEMSQGVKSSQGLLRKFFLKMLGFDLVANKKFYDLSPDANEQALKIATYVFRAKIKLIQQVLQQQNL